MKVNWVLVAVIALAVWWFMFSGRKSYYANIVCQAAEIDAVAEPVNSVPSMLPSVAGVAMGSSSYRAKTCGACGM